MATLSIMKLHEPPISPDEDEGEPSPAHELLAAVLGADDPEQAIHSASYTALRSLVRYLRKSNIREEFGVLAAGEIHDRATMIRYVLEFIQKGVDYMRLSGAADVVVDNEPQDKTALTKIGLAYGEDERRNPISPFRSQRESNKITYGQPLPSVERLPSGRAHWLRPKQFAKAHRKRDSRSLARLANVLHDLMQEKHELRIAGASYKPTDILGIYSVPGHSPDYYINPAVSHWISKRSGWAAPRIPGSRRHWIPITLFVLKHLNMDPKSANGRLSLLVEVFLSDPEAAFRIEGETFAAGDLFGYYSKIHSHYYINPIAIDVIRNAFGWIPFRPADKSHWQSSHEMLEACMTRPRAQYYAGQLDKLAKRFLSAPDEKLNIGTADRPAWRLPKDVVGRFRQGKRYASYFFNPVAGSFLLERVGLYAALPADKRHFLPTKTIADRAGLRLGQAEAIIKQIARRLYEQDEIDAFDLVSGATRKVDPRSVIMEILSIVKPGQKMYIEPGIARQYFSKERMLKHSASTASELHRNPGVVPALPLEKESWISFSVIRGRCGIIKATDPLVDVLKEYLRRLCRQGHPAVGYYFTGGGVTGTYFADPDSVGRGRTISRQAVLAFQSLFRSAATEAKRPPMRTQPLDG